MTILAAVGTALKLVPRPAWIALAIALAIAFAVWRGIAWYDGQITAAEARGAARAYANVESQARELEARANALNTRIAAEIRKRNDEDLRRIAADADDLRVRGPGAARCTVVSGFPASSGGREQTGGAADAPGPGLPPQDRAAVPWGWLVARAEQADLNRAEAVAWREWHARFKAEWDRWNAEAEKARSAPRN